MKRQTLITVTLLGLLLVLSFVIAPYPTLAQTADWCYTFDFTDNDGGWVAKGSPYLPPTSEPDWATYQSGSGWVTVDDEADNSGSYYRRVIITKTFTSSTITNIGVTYDYVRGINNANAALSIRMNSTSYYALGLDEISDGNPRFDEWTGSQNNVTNIDVYVASYAASTASYAGSATIKSVVVYGTGTNPFGSNECESNALTKPLEERFFGPEGLAQTSNPSVGPVIAYSDIPGRPVYALTSGTITNITYQPSLIDCQSLMAGMPLAPQVSKNCHIPHISGDGASFQSAGGGFSPKIEAYLITLSGDDGNTYKYLVDNASQYIDDGQTVQAGCILGVTLEQSDSAIAIDILTLEPSIIEVEREQGVAVVSKLGELDVAQNLLADLTINPSPSTACNVDPEFASCYGDNTLEQESQWTSQGGVGWNQPGVTLNPGASITSAAPFNLNETALPHFKISARSFGASTIKLTLGNTTEVINIVSGTYSTYEITPGTHTPDLSGYYTVSIANTGNATVDVQYMCISHTLDDTGNPKPPERPAVDGCYFGNHNFDEGTANWIVSSFVTSGDGSIVVQDNQTFGQSANLYTADNGDPQAYTVTVTSALAYYSNYTPDPTDSSGDVTVSFEYPVANGFTTIGAVTYGEYAQQNNLITSKTTFTLNSDTDDYFTFKVSFNNKPTGVHSLDVRSVCLEAGDTTNGGSPDEFPGDWTDDTPQDLFAASCETISRPQGNDIGPWINWHWHNLNQFFTCELMTLLNSWYRKTVNFFNTMTWAVRWLMMYIATTMEWLAYQVIPYFSGYLDNMRGGGFLVYGETESNNSCEWYDLICHGQNILSGIGDFFSDSFDALKGLPDLLTDIVNGLIDSFNWLMDKLEGLFKWLWDGLTSFWNWIRSGINWMLDFITDVFKPIIDLGLDLINTVVGWLSFAREFLSELVTSYNNATPQPVPGVPDCQSGSTEVLCMFYWMIENTILSGSIGVLYIPVIVSILTILFAISYVRQIKKLIVETIEAI